MKRAAFEFLYIHANSLAELGLDQFAAELPIEGSDEFARLGADEREALAVARMRNVDMASMMEGFGWETVGHDAAVRDSLQQMQAGSAPDADEPGRAEAAPVDVASTGPNLASYLEHAYAASGQIALRVDQGMARVDIARLDSLVAALPGDLPPLTEALGADGLAQWLACYRAGHDSLQTLVTLFSGMAIDS